MLNDELEWKQNDGLEWMQNFDGLNGCNYDGFTQTRQPKSETAGHEPRFDVEERQLEAN